MIATNAAGARSLTFGAMRQAVCAIDCVFADGSRATVRRGGRWRDVPALATLADDAMPRLAVLAADGPLARPGVRKESSGYAVDAFLAHDDVVDLIVGSEGTLCLVVGAELALRDLPGSTSTILAAFASLDDAVDAAIHAAAAGATACELLDRTFLDVARSGGHASRVPRATEAVLLAEVEGLTPHDASARASAMAAGFSARGALAVHTALEPVAEAELWEIRHAASPTIALLHPQLRSMQFIEDGAVPPDQFARYIRGVRDALARQQLQGVIFGHAGDAHAHVNPLVDVGNPEWRSQVTTVLDDVTRLVGELGGTLSGEHGDGRLRTPLMAQVWPVRAREAFALVKRAMDPTGLLNPGVKVPLEGQTPLDCIKYDPSLPALPAGAAAVLRQVAQTRAYARCRLDLLDESH